MSIALYVAAFLIAAVSLAHSWLGERYILMRLFRRDDLPKLFGSADFTIRTMRFAWHLTSVAWLGLAGVLLLVAHPPIVPQELGLVVGVTFVLHGVIALGASRGRHYAWVVFLAIAALAVLATRP